MNSKPPIAPIAAAADCIVSGLEALGIGARIEKSNASNSSAYVYAFLGDGSPEVKIRVSNHPVRKSALWRHRASDIELILPGGRPQHVVEQVKAHFRKSLPLPAES